MQGGSSLSKESSKVSSDGLDSSTDQPSDDANSGRFYECIFCKRGFSTAQALGGHMNIHRKDRAKMKDNIIHSASKLGVDGSEDNIGYGYYNPSLNGHNNHRPFYPPVSESLKNYSMFFPKGVSSNRNILRNDAKISVRPRELSLFGDDLHLGLRVHGDFKLGGEERRERARGKEGEVDLELRLGN